MVFVVLHAFWHSMFPRLLDAYGDIFNDNEFYNSWVELKNTCKLTKFMFCLEEAEPFWPVWKSARVCKYCSFHRHHQYLPESSGSISADWVDSTTDQLVPKVSAESPQRDVGALWFCFSLLEPLFLSVESVQLTDLIPYLSLLMLMEQTEAAIREHVQFIHFGIMKGLAKYFLNMT